MKKAIFGILILLSYNLLGQPYPVKNVNAATGGEVNVRASSITGNIVGRMYFGSRVYAWQLTNDGWYETSVPDNGNYFYYVTGSSTYIIPDQSAPYIRSKADYSRTNVRSAASSTAAQVTDGNGLPVYVHLNDSWAATGAYQRVGNSFWYEVYLLRGYSQEKGWVTNDVDNGKNFIEFYSGSCNSPIISSSPTSTTLNAGGTLNLSVSAYGSGLTYNWRKDGVSVGNFITFQKPNVTASDAGTYTCIVSNACGSAISASATVTVTTPTCNYNFNQSVMDVGASAGSNSVTMQTGANCSWNVSNNNPSFVTLNNSSGTGQQAINFSYTSNPTTSTREAIISGNGGTSCTIRQAGQQVTNYTITANSNPQIGGNITGNNGSYTAGQTAILNAQANSGYSFTNWTENGSVVFTQATYQFSVNNNRTLTANFTQNVQNYTITANANTGGTAFGTNTYPANSPATVSANANTGYSFRDWTENGNFLTSQNPHSFIVTSSRTLVANFTATPGCNPTVTAGSNSIPATGGTGSFTVTAGNGCTWSLTPSNCSFVQLSTSSGTGNATVSYTVPANSTQNPLTCTISLGGQTYTITQNGANQNCPLVKPVIRLMAGCVLSVPSQTDVTYQWKRLSTVVGTSSNLYEVTNSGLYLCTVSLPNIPTCSSITSEYFHVLYSNGSCVVNNSEIESLTQLNIYPNPNKGLFTVDFDLPEPKMTAIRVYNALGQCVYTAAAEKRVGHQTQSIDLKKGTSGLYWVEIQLDDQKIVKKVMVE